MPRHSTENNRDAPHKNTCSAVTYRRQSSLQAGAAVREEACTSPVELSPAELPAQQPCAAAADAGRRQRAAVP